jgi:hypothetical protein
LSNYGEVGEVMVLPTTVLYYVEIFRRKLLPILPSALIGESFISLIFLSFVKLTKDKKISEIKLSPMSADDDYLIHIRETLE